jgi:predicted P-loop ATPase
MVDICDWLGRAQRLPVTRPSLIEKCVITQCKKAPRDLLQLWLNSLPAWDRVPRLTCWLQQIAGVEDTNYGRDVSRVLPVSMIARALNPGCHYRFVVIFEGEENIGKTALVRAIASHEWYVELAMNLDSKEAHMMLQGVWVAELSELDSLNRTEETRLKAFITLHEDSYVPKFSNFRDRAPRRAIFIATTNEDSYLKGQSGNTRFLPIRLPQPVDLDLFAGMREQLFAEAKAYYLDHADDWWQLSDEAMAQAVEEREKRRIVNHYEQPLYEWLEYTRFIQTYHDEFGQPITFVKGQTSWPEIARYFLSMENREKWKDKSLQSQIAQALRQLGWRPAQIKVHGRTTSIWRKRDDVPF